MPKYLDGLEEIQRRAQEMCRELPKLPRIDFCGPLELLGFARRLEEFRPDPECTTSFWAFLIGISEDQLREMLRGSHDPGGSVLRKIVSWLYLSEGIPAEDICYLMTGERLIKKTWMDLTIREIVNVLREKFRKKFRSK